MNLNIELPKRSAALILVTFGVVVFGVCYAYYRSQTASPPERSAAITERQARFLQRTKHRNTQTDDGIELALETPAPARDYSIIAHRNLFKPIRFSTDDGENKKPNGNLFRHPTSGGNIVPPVMPPPHWSSRFGQQPPPGRPLPEPTPVGGGQVQPPQGPTPPNPADKPKEIAVTFWMKEGDTPYVLIENVGANPSQSLYVTEGDQAFGYNVARIDKDELGRKFVELERGGTSYRYYIGENKQERKSSAPRITTVSTGATPPAPPAGFQTESRTVTLAPPGGAAGQGAPGAQQGGGFRRRRIYEILQRSYRQRYGDNLPPHAQATLERYRQYAEDEERGANPTRRENVVVEEEKQEQQEKQNQPQGQ